MLCPLHLLLYSRIHTQHSFRLLASVSTGTVTIFLLGEASRHILVHELVTTLFMPLNLKAMGTQREVLLVVVPLQVMR